MSLTHEYTLEQLGTFEKSYSFSRALEGNGEYRHIHYGDIHTKLPYIIQHSKILPTITENQDFDTVKYGDILIADASEDYKDLGKAVCFFDSSDSKVIAGLHTHRLKPNSNLVNPEYLINIFQTNRYRKFVWKMGTGVSVLGLSKSNLAKYTVNIPSLEDQEKIAKFFSGLDKKIQLQQEKMDLLKEQKKGYMQKIFTQELRFKDDNHQFFIDWKEVELGNISVTFSGGTPSVSNKSYYNGTIPFIRSGEIHTDKTELYISETAIKSSSAKMVEKGDILYALYGATSGEVAISQIDGAINQAILCIRTNENKFFLKYWLENMKENILNVYLQGGQGNLSASIIKSLKINLPHIDEQAIIAEFFVKIDKKIQREKIKLNFLMQQKQAFMQQMFI